jgi:hypothetical protein
MVTKVGEKLNAGKWLIISALVPIVIIAVVFAVPFKTVPVQETESYWATEMKEEAYTVMEDYTTTELYQETETKSETVYDSYLTAGNSYTFEVDKPDSTVTVKMSDYPYGGYYASYVVVDDTNPYYFRYWPNYYWDSRAKVLITLSYPEQVTREKLVTKQRDVVKYREVPTEVLKERTTTKYVKMSIWHYLFMDQPS